MRKKVTRCKHFHGVGNDKCLAGVKYELVTLNHGTPKSSFPCLGEKYNPLGATCDKCEYPTPEEIAAEEEADAKRMQNTMAARKAIVDSLGGHWKKGMPSQRGLIDCPVCKGQRTLRFDRSGYNGHIHAGCTTNGCVQWME